MQALAPRRNKPAEVSEAIGGNADDIAASEKYGVGNEKHVLLLTDRQVKDRGVLDKIREFLSATTVNDRVVLYVAGHGMPDDKHDHYYTPAGFDPERIAETGITLDELTGCLQSANARKTFQDALPAIKLLIQHGANIRLPDCNGKEPPDRWDPNYKVSEQPAAAAKSGASMDNIRAVSPAVPNSPAPTYSMSGGDRSNLQPMINRTAALRCREALSALYRKRLPALLPPVRDGADVNAVTEKGATPSDCVGSDNGKRIRGLLKSRGAKHASELRGGNKRKFPEQ